MGWCYWNIRGSACSKQGVVLAWRRCPWVVPPASDLVLSSFLVRIRIPSSSRNTFSRPKVGRKKNWFFLEITKWNQKCTPGRTDRPGAILCLLETPHCVGLAMHVSPGVRKGIVLRPSGTRSSQSWHWRNGRSWSAVLIDGSTQSSVFIYAKVSPHHGVA